MPAHKPNESIEGLKIQGHSRKPLRTQSLKIINGIRCFQFKAEFNVSAEVVIELANEAQQIYTDALTKRGDKLGGDTALIATIAKNNRTPRLKDLFNETVESHISHTHGANVWESKQQANARIVIPRQEIINALEKRNKSIQSTNVEGK